MYYILSCPTCEVMTQHICYQPDGAFEGLIVISSTQRMEVFIIVNIVTNEFEPSPWQETSQQQAKNISSSYPSFAPSIQAASPDNLCVHRKQVHCTRKTD